MQCGPITCNNKELYNWCLVFSLAHGMACLLVAHQTLPITKMEKKFLGHARKNVYTFSKEIKTLFKSRKLNQNEDKLTFK